MTAALIIFVCVCYLCADVHTDIYDHLIITSA